MKKYYVSVISLTILISIVSVLIYNSNNSDIKEVEKSVNTSTIKDECQVNQVYSVINENIDVTEETSNSTSNVSSKNTYQKVENSNKNQKKTTQKAQTTTKASSKKDFSYFKKAQDEIQGYLNSEDLQKLKEKGKYYVTTGIDFVFYNKAINGVYFNELKDDVKEQVLKQIRFIDELICKKFPNYKENISSKYKIASEFIHEKYLNVLDKIRNYLGDENYTALGNIKNQIISDLSNTKNKAVNYIKDKYNNWRNK